MAAAVPDVAAVRVISETDLLRQLGLLDTAAAQRLYTPAMIADLLGVTTSVVRGWQRRGLITPVREVRKLPYFDFREVQTARRLLELLAAGASADDIQQQLSALQRMLPNVERPLEQLSVIIEGRDLLLRQGSGLVESGGQYRLDFDAEERGADDSISVEPPALDAAATAAAREEAGKALPDTADEIAPPRSVEQLRRAAVRADDEGRLAEAADLLRAALATSGPDAETCFQLAEVLYRLGDRGGARERYFAAVELDEDYVEARANLGCLLAEEGRYDLAVAAFEGALEYHDDYADVHYHLAHTLDMVDRGAEAERHWRSFLDLAPQSPWADDARRRLGLPPVAAAEDD